MHLIILHKTFWVLHILDHDFILPSGDVDSVERFDDFRRQKSPKIGTENRQIDANHGQIMQIISNFWKGSQLCMTLFQGDYFVLCSYYFFSSIEIIYWSLKSSFWRDFRLRKSSKCSTESLCAKDILEKVSDDCDDIFEKVSNDAKDVLEKVHKIIGV